MAAHAQQQRMAGEFAGRQRIGGDAGQTGIFGRRRFGVQFQDAALFGDGGGDDHAGGGRAEMGEGDFADGKIRFDQQEDGGIGDDLALGQQPGLAERQAVACRPAQGGHRRQGRVDGGDKHVFLTGQPIDQQQPEQRPLRVGTKARVQASQRRHPVRYRQGVQPRQDQGRGAKVGRRKADGYDAVRGIARRPDFTGGRTAHDHAAVGQARPQHGVKRSQVRTIGAKDQDQARIGSAQAVQQDTAGVGPLAVGLHGHRPGGALLRSRAGIHHPASNRRTVLASSTAWVRRRALILDMMAVMWVFTVASAMDRS